MSTFQQSPESLNTPKLLKQAVHILKSYLSAVGITHAPGESANLLKLKTLAGAEMSVSVGDGVATVTVNAEDIASYEMDRALNALHTVTVAAGFGKPVPVDRGQAPAERISYHDNFELVYLRAPIFRRSPNRTENELEPYMKTVKGCARRAMFRWRNVFQGMGFNESDLVNVGTVYTISFIHNYASDPDQINNLKLLTEFLHQRFGEFAKISYKKALNSTCLPQSIKSESSDEVSYIDTYAEADEPALDEEYEEVTLQLTYEDGSIHNLRMLNDGFIGLDAYLDGNLLPKSAVNDLRNRINSGAVKTQPLQADIAMPKTERKHARGLSKAEKNEAVLATDLSTLDGEARRLTAKAQLHLRLEALDVETRETLVSYAALSRDYCPDTRREARKIAEELLCPKCQKKVASGVVCPRCSVEARPRYGIDYLGFREKLKAQNHTMAEAMSSPVPDSEARIRAKRPLQAGVKALVSMSETEVAAAVVPAQMPMPEADLKAMKEKMVADVYAKLPPIAKCPRCKVDLPIHKFGVRIAHDKGTGLPCRAMRQSYCNPCRGPKKKE
jgi:hypothetical protein